VWSGDGLTVVGHRGVRSEPEGENTLAAFERALRDGATAVELDVRVCATGEVVVFHDPELKRATGGADLREVRDVPYAELGAIHLFGGSQGAPLLRHILSLAKDLRAGVNVELKHDLVDAPALVTAVAAEIARGPFDVLVSSFDPRLVVRIKARAPRTRVALITTPERKWTLPLARVLARSRLLHAVHLERTQVTRHVVRSLEASGVCVGVWTVNDPTEAVAMRDLGVNWVITDKPRAVAREMATSQSRIV
jgi:glycerophosphoryl diester phosphodiesterase